MPFSLRRTASLVLRDWEQSGAFAADLIDAASRVDSLDPRNRAALQRLVYGVIRNQRLLDHVIDSLVRDRPDPLSRRLLRLGLAEVLLLDSSPHAAVHETVGLAGRTKSLVNAVLRRALREIDLIRASWETLAPEIRWSVPGFLWKRWIAQYGEAEAAKLAMWNQQPSPVYLRLNASPDHPLDLEAAHVEAVPGHPAYVSVREDLPRDWMDRGWAYAQDPSTQGAIDRLQVTPDSVILDACAAPGGKTLAIVQAGAQHLWATDQSPDRLAQMRETFRRLRIDARVKTAQQDWLQPLADDLVGLRFDRILIDAPCSNTGVIRRRIDVPWRLRPEDFITLPSTQLALLETLASRLRPNGRIVYSTCSLDHEENEQVTARFLERHPSFGLLSEGKTLPWKDGFDGAYSAAFAGA